MGIKSEENEHLERSLEEKEKYFSQAIENFFCEIQTLKRLRHLTFRGAKVEELSETIAALEELELLCITGDDYQVFPTVISQCRALRYLCISPGALKKVPENVVDLEKLELLVISQNGKLVVDGETVLPRPV